MYDGSQVFLLHIRFFPKFSMKFCDLESSQNKGMLINHISGHIVTFHKFS